VLIIFLLAVESCPRGAVEAAADVVVPAWGLVISSKIFNRFDAEPLFGVT
jgi:hypothetical protein